MIEVVIREGVFGSIIYLENIGRISLRDMSIDGHEICIEEAKQIYLKKDLTFPYKKIEIEEGLLERIVNFAKNPPEDTRLKNQQIEDLREQLRENYSIDVF